jgi:pyruvate dehydrogenase E2 component (dihydrolipoamide acetyltransferase)
MPEQVIMPRLSDTMTEGTVSKWLKHPGDDVKKGEPIVEIETDKANIELEAYASGKLAKIILQEGQSAPVGEPIGEIALAGESVAPASGGTAAGAATSAEAAAKSTTPENPGTAVAETDQKRPEATQAQAQQAEPTPVAQPAGSQAPPASAQPHAASTAQETQPRGSGSADSSGSNGQLRASPMARRIARELGVDLTGIHGSGPLGRIQKDDVEAAAKSSQGGRMPGAEQAALAAADVEVVQLSRMQQTIARRMVEAKTAAPHFYVTMEVDMARAVTSLEELNEGVAKEELVTINDLIVRACALALRDYPDVNSFYQDGSLIRNKRINVGVAVAVPGGLVEPVLRDADQKSLKAISTESKAMSRKVRDGKVDVHDYEGGTFSISNLGMYGVTEFSAIINPPHSAILAVGAVHDQAVVIDGQLAVSKRCMLTLSADHRVFYGATAAEFLRAVKRKLEKPLGLFV